MNKCPNCGASVSKSSGGSTPDQLYCNKSAKLVGFCDGKTRC